MPKDCRDTALRYLEHRERSAHEVKAHLISKGFREDEIDEVMKYLEDFKFVDDARYCRSYIEYGIRKGRGPVRLRHELTERGIAPLLIQEILEECFDRNTEKDAAMKEVQKLLHFDEASAPDEKTIARIGRKLASLGYHTELIYDIIGRLRRL